MKIAFDGKRYFHNTTGLGNYSRTLVELLAQNNPENIYYLVNPKYRKKYTIPKNLKNVKEINPKNILYKNISAIWRQKTVVKDLTALNIDIFHGLSGEIPIGLEKQNIASIVTIHDLIFVRYPELYSFIDRNIYLKKFKHAAQKATKIVAITEQTKQDIIEFLNIEESKIEVIYQGCHKVFKESFSIEALKYLKKKYNLPDKFLLYVGTIEKRKNLKIIIDAIKENNYPLVVVGKKTKYYEEEILPLISKHHLEKSIFHLKNLTLEELAMLYQLATIFIYPSFFEGFGIPILEALYSKTPVITSRGSCFPEAGGPNSIYIDPNSANELIMVIEKLWNDESLRQSIADKGWDFAQQFNDAILLDKWNRLYSSIL